MANINYRLLVIDDLIPFAQQEPRIILLVCDMGFGVCDKFKKKFPKRIYNVGVMEQATVGMAAGMAMNGLIPVVYSIVNFLFFRALEQIRNDVVLQKLNVKFIGTGANNYFKFLGPSHCCEQDDKKICKLIGLKLYDPYRGQCDFKNLFAQWILDKAPAYIRV
ncbi:MAG: transketolase [Oligoflexia bacterium]|nr:transketolase [Oligoflexia bacterium]